MLRVSHLFLNID